MARIQGRVSTNRLERRILLSLLGFAFLLTIWPGYAAAISSKICTDLEVRSDDRIVFSKTERLFLCGDSDNAPWSAPSQSQIKHFMNSFLQSRGYLEPRFIQEGTSLVVETGDKSRVRILASDDTPPELDFTRFWVPRRKTLMPSLLDEYEDLVRGRIEAEGYPCPSVTATANSTDDSMIIRSESGPRQKIKLIEENENLGLREGTLRRYFPVKEGDWFNGDLVHIANERIKASEILGGSYMVTTCDPDGAVIHHRSVIGPPRRVTAGIGFNTETYAITRVTYHSSRLDANASNFSARLSASYVRQHLESNFEWYFLTRPLSVHFKPTLSFDRINEKSSEERTGKGSWHLGAYSDLGTENIRGYIGPNLNLIQTLRGTGPEYARILEVEANARIMSHAYEFYQGAPRSGHLLDLRYTTASEKTFSTLDVRTYSAKGEILFNALNMEPTLLVLGFRARAAASDAPPDAILPDQYLYYIGGSDDVRGFNRRSIPSPTAGARSILTGGSELRLTTVIPYGVQPFLFVDAGKLGTKPFAYDPTIYYSPGAGVRWQSPIGSLRGSIARGLVQSPDLDIVEDFPARWNAFISFGEEF